MHTTVGVGLEAIGSSVCEIVFKTPHPSKLRGLLNQSNLSNYSLISRTNKQDNFLCDAGLVFEDKCILQPSF
ncbi:hypothetical protein EG68_03871 [Paragonimus skrjabini miyazakii]|uniref:Uncharacterized protein n=1 Tax=Paragonimus skrjabini miyazakii TaxID=59628 RepID=A0A8S9Z530_9TREM|nr:hypothetical protein EG68_03871 [Paragonimus skrjabini miyazakii]